MNKLRIGNLIARIPIIQGGMGIGISLSGLASAVANEGGVGVISAVVPGFREKDLKTNFKEANIRALRNEIQIARSKSSGVIGINVMVALTNYEDMVRTAIEEKIDIIISGAGLPLNLPSFLPKTSKTKLVPIVSTHRAAEILFKKWLQNYDFIPDAIILESPFSGGHQGVKYDDISQAEFDIETQLPKILDVIDKNKKHKKIPLIVGGGVYTGSDIKKYMDMGASGVQMGTRFISTIECDADQKYKEAFINCNSKDDIIVIKSPVGLPLRLFKNEFVNHALLGNKKPKKCIYKCLHVCNFKKVDFCILEGLSNAQQGFLSDGIICSGINGYRNEEIISVKELFRNIKKEYHENSVSIPKNI